MNPKARTKTILYSRVSSVKQADSGLSMEAQETKCRQYAALYDLEIVEVITDPGESAKSLDRPGLKRAIAMLESGAAEALLVAKLDRLTRSVVDLGTLLALFDGDERALLSVQDQIDTRSATGRLVLNVLASVSQWEREAIGERTATALNVKRTRGERLGQVPLGFKSAAIGPVQVTRGGVERRTAMLIPDEGEMATIAAARELRATGLSLRAVAAELLVRGHKPRKGPKFLAETIARMCRVAAS